MKSSKNKNIRNLRLNLLCLSMLISGSSIAITSFNIAKSECYATSKIEKEFIPSDEFLNDNKLEVNTSENTQIEPVEEMLPNPLDRSTLGGNDIIVLFNYKDDYYDIYLNKYVTEENLLKTESFVVTVDNKTYEFLGEDAYKTFVAVVATECNGNIYDALAVASSILNRCINPKWVNFLNEKGKDGTNPIEQISYPGQYESYITGRYKKYLDGTLEVPNDILLACEAAWYKGVRNNKYCSFRSKFHKGYSSNQIVNGGNRFKDLIMEDKTNKNIKNITLKPVNTIEENIPVAAENVITEPLNNEIEEVLIETTNIEEVNTSGEEEKVLVK